MYNAIMKHIIMVFPGLWIFNKIITLWSQVNQRDVILFWLNNVAWIKAKLTIKDKTKHPSNRY